MVEFVPVVLKLRLLMVLLVKLKTGFTIVDAEVTLPFTTIPAPAQLPPLLVTLKESIVLLLKVITPSNPPIYA